MIENDLKVILKNIDEEDRVDKLIEEYITPHQSIVEKLVYDLLVQKYHNKTSYEEGSIISFNGFTIEKISAYYKDYDLVDVEDCRWRIIIKYTYYKKRYKRFDTIDIPIHRVYNEGIEKILLEHQKNIEEILAHPCLVKEF